jgi:hypothetical protein
MRFITNLSVLAALWLAMSCSVVAEQDSTRIYPFLNAVANDHYALARADYFLTDLIARENCEEFLTDDLIKISLRAYWGNADTCLRVFVDTRPQPQFESNVSGNGRFRITDREVKVVFTDAAHSVMRKVDYCCKLFGFEADRILISFSLRGNTIGSYFHSTFSLTGE